MVEIERVDDVPSLQGPDIVVVESHVVVDGLRIADETVVGDDLDAQAAGRLQNRPQSRSVDRADHDHSRGLVDHRLDLGVLLLDLVVRELELHDVPEVLQQGLEVLPVPAPALEVLRGHRHADERAVAPVRSPVVVGGPLSGARRERPREDGRAPSDERPTCQIHLWPPCLAGGIIAVLNVSWKTLSIDPGFGKQVASVYDDRR